jgi:hypothetical protein
LIVSSFLRLTTAQIMKTLTRHFSATRVVKIDLAIINDCFKVSAMIIFRDLREAAPIGLSYIHPRSSLPMRLHLNSSDAAYENA